jgi:hypothetical protein
MVTAKNGSDVQQCLEEAVKNMNIAKLKKIQVILTITQEYMRFYVVKRQ